MQKIESYLQTLQRTLLQSFGDRLLYLGLQGSYMRNEATPASDIDVMVVLDTLQLSDLEHYRQILHTLGHADKSCGFICGQADLRNWNRCEICHLLHSTKDLYGNLHALVPPYTREDVKQYAKWMAGTLYHQLCHTFLHAPHLLTADLLQSCEKTAFFILQNVAWLQTGRFPVTKSETASLPDTPYTLLSLAPLPPTDDPPALLQRLETLLCWCQNLLTIL